MSGAVAAGFFGKLPNAGDFLQRRLPAGFADVWDPRFEIAMAEIRATLGERWPLVFGQSPLWRFVLSPGACGKAACAGVVGPGRDRVGRQFPMVIVAALGGERASCAQALQAGSGWFGAAERLLRSGQSDASMSVDAFDSRVAALPGPLEGGAEEGIAPLRGVDWGASDHWRMSLPNQAPASSVISEIWAQLPATGTTWCLWWTRGSERVPVSVLVTKGLPQPSAYVAFLDAAVASTSWRPLGAGPSVEDLQPVVPRQRIERIPIDLADDILESITSQPIESPPSRLLEPATDPDRVVPCAVISRSDCALTLVAAECASPSAGRNALERVAAIARELPAADLEGGTRVLRARLSALHVQLQAEHPADCAIAAAHLRKGYAAVVLRVGSAGVWIWRRGQLQSCFSADSGAAPAMDGLGGNLDDLLFGQGPAPLPGLGTSAELRCDEGTFPLEVGDRLLLATTPAVVQLSPDLMARALGMRSCDEARARIAGACGLGSEPTHWPLAIIEIGA